MISFLVVLLTVLVSIILIRKNQIVGALATSIFCTGFTISYPLLALVPGTIVVYCVYLLWRDK